MRAVPRSSAPPAAKFVPPQMHGVLRRPRLLALLRVGRRRRITWIAGAPGSGKTALVASHLAATRERCLWLTIGVEDAHPATFFHHLNLAASRLAPRRRSALAPLTPEYQSDLPRYARRAFASVFAGRRATLIVLDGCQHLPEGSALHALLPEMLAEVPDGLAAIVISHAEPGRLYARLAAQGALRIITGDDLALTGAEARACARGHGLRHHTGTGTALTPQERVLEYLFFRLSTCIAVPG